MSRFLTFLRRSALALLGLSAVSSFSLAQNSFQRTYGSGNNDWGYSIQQTSDSGYIITGYTTSFGAGSYDVYLIKTNSSGDTLWTRTYGDTGWEQGRSVWQTFDGGYIVAGYTTSFGAGSADVYLIKTNSSGDTLWTRTYGGTGWDVGGSVQQTSDSGYIIAGYAAFFGAGSDDVYLIRTNSLGDTLWTRTYGSTGYDGGGSVEQTSDGGYIIAGYDGTLAGGPYDVYLVKVDSSGDSLWTKKYGGSGDDWGRSVQQTSDGGYTVAGSTTSFGAGSSDVYLIRTNSSGDTMWTKTYGGAGDDNGHSLQLTTDGGYIFTGLTTSFGAGLQDLYLIRTNSSGDTLWTRTHGGTGVDVGSSVQQTSDGGYVIAGLTDSFGAGSYDVYLIKTLDDGTVGIHDDRNLRRTAYVLLQNYPNPFNPATTVSFRLPSKSFVSLRIFDILGGEVSTLVSGELPAGDHARQWDAAGSASGVYFCRLQAGSFTETKKLILLR